LSLIGTLWKDRLLRSGYIIILGSIIAGGINFFYQIYISRALGPEDTGEFGALYSLSFFLSYILLRTIRVSTTSFVSKLRGLGKDRYIPLLYRTIFSKLLILGSISTVIFVVTSAMIADFLQINSAYLVVFVASTFILSWLFPINLGILQGIQGFKDMAIANVSQSVGKMISGTLLIFLGFGVFGALAGLVMGAVVALVLSYFFIIQYFRIQGWESQKKGKMKKEAAIGGSDRKLLDGSLGYSEMFHFSVITLIAVICLGVPTNIDMLMVKHYFSDEESGLYFAATIFGRMVFFLPMGITIAMYPMVAEAHAKKEPTMGLLKRGMLYTGAPTAAVAVFFSFFPQVFITFFSSEFADAEDFVRYYGIFMLFFSMSSVLVYYNLAMGRFLHVYMFSAFTAISVVLVYLNHDSLTGILTTFLWVNIVFFVISIIYTFMEGDSHIKGASVDG